MFKAFRNLFMFLFVGSSLFARDVLLEFKGAYFYPTDSCVRDIYGKGGALYGPEVTFQLCQDQNWYGFASIDFFNKKGCSVGLCGQTKMSIMPVAVGVKYFVPFCYGDFYVGLGFQPARLKTENCSPDVIRNTSKWGFGGIAKVGSYFDLPCSCFLDVFLDYSFVKVGCEKYCGSVVPLKADISGVVFGAGLGYRFN